MKICHVIFSTNRLEYLGRTLDSLKKLDYSNALVDRIIIDDYPQTRNDKEFLKFISKYKFDEVILNKENLGITKNWQKLFDIVNNNYYDFILHQEDDVELLFDIKLKDMVDLLNSNTNLRQVQLKRNNWYDTETEIIGPKDSDVIFNNFRYEMHKKYFWMMFSLYHSWICRENILEETKKFPSEINLGTFLFNKYNLQTALLKTEKGLNYINHFGEYSQGLRVSNGDQSINPYKWINPNYKYLSKNGIKV